MGRGPYQSYSYDFKKSILANRSVGIGIRVPRSTKHYWRHKSVGRALHVEFGDPNDSDSIKDALESQRHLVRALCIALTNLFRGGKFNQHVTAAVWADLKRRLDIEVLQELKHILPRDILEKITAPTCKKSDDGQCLTRYPHKVALSEIKEMRRLVVSKRLGHFSISSLCLYAKRKSLVSCNRDTWYRYINRYGWQRPVRNKKFKPKHTGLRAKRPDEIWHIDVTHIKLSDGTRYYLHVLLDNFSRRVLAWILNKKLSAVTTVELLKQADRNNRQEKVDLVTDGGSENVNRVVRATIETTKPRIVHKIAQVEIKKSNSMVERLFHSLKNRYLYSQDLDTARNAEKNICFYMNEHNDVIPQAVLSGLTPAEAHAGKNPDELTAKLDAFALEKRKLRFEQNRSNVCPPCKGKFTNSTSKDEFKCAK